MPRVLSTAAILTALVASSTSLACTRSSARARPAAPVRFTISLDARAFAPGSTVDVDVWSQAKLIARAGTARPAPERFTFMVDELAHGFTIAALSVRIGEVYEIAIGGRASDGCNQAGATARGVVAAGEIALADLEIYQTTMACRAAA